MGGEFDMSLAAIAYLMVATFMVLIMTKKVSAQIALILVPSLFAVIAGFHEGLGKMMLEGVKDLAPTGIMLIFAILYFGIMIDAGLFDPLIKRIVKIVRGDPVKILIGTAVLALLVSLDGDGSTTYMITVAAMLPLYKHMRMDPLKMACVIMLSGMVMNILPWGGPTARVMTALRLDASVVFTPLIPAMIATAGWVLFVAWRLGLSERARLALLPEDAIDEDASAETIIAEDSARHLDARRPKLLWFNFALTALLMVCLIKAVLPLAILFMIGFAIAITVNYPGLEQQRDRIAAYAPNALAVAGLIFAAGIFTGILSGTKMVDAMSATVTGFIPPSLGAYMAPITALVSIPFTFLISNDAFYFGMLPILAKTGAVYGVSAAEIGRASLVGQQFHLLSPLVASTYLLVGLAGVELGDHQKFTAKWALGSCLVFFLICLLVGVFPFAASH
jgi:citrate-Mg2+:H+ or citrate-Ca2+:H+ symporter, CitMHS family